MTAGIDRAKLKLGTIARPTRATGNVYVEQRVLRAIIGMPIAGTTGPKGKRRSHAERHRDMPGSRIVAKGAGGGPDERDELT